MKILQFNPYQCKAGRGGAGRGWGGLDLKSLIPSSPYSRPFPTLPPLQGRKNLHKVKRRGGGLNGVGQNCHPELGLRLWVVMAMAVGVDDGS